MSSGRGIKQRKEFVEGRLKPLLRVEISMRQEFSGARKMGGNFFTSFEIDEQIGERGASLGRTLAT
jgi:hypothetical protein